MNQSQSAPKKIVVIGAGKLGSLIIDAWIAQRIVKPAQLHVIVRTEASAKKFRRLQPKVKITSTERTAGYPAAPLYVIAVKPQQWHEIKAAVRDTAPRSARFISIMAGLKPSQLRADLNRPVAVAMTNTAVQVGTALTSLFASDGCPRAHIALTTKLFRALGSVYPLDERYFARATALGGSHPAFVIWMLQKINAIVTEELPSLAPRAAQAWVEQIFLGSLRLLEAKGDADALLKQIATPGGCTAEGLKALEDLDVAPRLRGVFEKCWIKAEQMGTKS